MIASRSRLVLTAMSAFGLMLGSAAIATAAPGDVDAGFGDGGTVLVQTVEDGFSSDDVYVRADGSFSVAGAGMDSGYYEYTGVVNFTANGRLDPVRGTSLDPDWTCGRLLDSGRAADESIAVAADCFEGSFASVSVSGADGIWRQRFTVGHTDGEALVVVPVADGVLVAKNSDATGDVVVERYGASGALVPSFGTAGRTVVNLGGAENVTEILTRSDGRVLVVGSTRQGGVTDAFVAQLTAGGVLDGAFGVSGVRKVNLGGTDDRVTAAILRTDGKVVIGGSAGGALGVARLTSTGTLDSTFDGDGRVRWAGLAAPADLAASGSGATAVAGSGYVLRYTAAGKPDMTFSGDGRATLTTVSDPVGLGHQSDGSLLVLGSGSVRVSRISPTGVEDSRFGVRGTASHIIDRGGEAFSDVVRRPDGSFVAVGSQEWPYQGESGGGGPSGLVHGFTASGASLDFTGAPGQSTVAAAAMQSDGKVVVAGMLYEYPEGDHFYVTRLNADGSRDRSFVSTGWPGAPAFSLPLDSRATAVTVRSDGRIVVAGERLDYESGDTRPGLLVARLRPNGAPDLSFSGDGIAFYPKKPGGAAGVLSLSDGRVVVCTVQNVVRLKAGGQLDTTFSGDGVAPYGCVADPVQAGSGRIVLAGSSSLMRLTSSGSLDPAFAVGGMAPVPCGGSDMAIDLAGRFVLAGGNCLSRLTSTAAVDTTFGGGDGVVTVPITVAAVAVDTKGYVLAGSGVSPGEGGYFPGDAYLTRIVAN